MQQTQKKHPMTSTSFGGEPLTQTQINTTCTPGLQKEKSPAYIHAESNNRLNFDSDEPESQSESEEELHESGGVDSGVKRTKFRRRSIVKNWQEHVKFDEEEEVVAFDVDGTRHLVKGSVQPRDVWNDAPGFRYFVQFNEFNQPLHKGGSILVSFLRDIAKREEFCPVGILNWHKLSSNMRGNIVNLVWAHFLLPEGKEMRNVVLKRTGKAWKNHRYALKKDYFDPVEKTREQNYASIPDGITTQNWSFLVDYWLSSDAKKMSELGKAARASQVLVGKSGAKSFANRKAILEDAIKKVQESLDNSSSSIPKVDIENEVFNQLMYQGEIPKRPLNYGFGVKQSDIFGVEGHLRKEGSYYVNNSDMEVEKLKVPLLDMKKQNEDLAEQNQILNTKFDAVGSMMAQLLKATCSGNVSSEVIDNAIQLLDSQPPPRYFEASLLKKMEELGIGRPSTYASILRVLQDKKYVTAKSRVLTPEFRGRMVSTFLSHYFNEVTDYSFTADMETELDNDSAGFTEWKGLLKDYWGRFSTYCERAGKVHIHQVEKMLERTYDNFLFSSHPEESRPCPSCIEGTLIFKVSRYGAGYFIGCDQHPKCKYGLLLECRLGYSRVIIESDAQLVVHGQAANVGV